MADSPPTEELIQELQNRSVVGTPILDRLQSSDVALNRNVSDRLLKRIRFRVKQRRTPKGFAARASNIVSGPISQTVDDELKFIVEENVETYLERRLEE